MIALTVIFVLLTYYVPFFSLIGTFLCGVPMAALAARNGFKAALPAVFGVFAVSVMVTGSVMTSFSVVMVSVIPGMAAGWCMGREKPFFVSLAVCCIAVCAGWMLELFAADKLMSGQGLEAMIKEASESMKLMLNTLLEAADGEGSAETENMVQTLIASAEAVIKLYLPSIVIVSSAMFGYVIMRLSAFTLRRAKIKDVKVVPFSRMKAPRSMANVSVILYVAFMFMKRDTVLWAVTANAVVVLFAAIGVCGFSFIDFKLSGRIVKGGARAAIYAAVFLFGGMLAGLAAYVLVFIGLLDSARNYRGIEAETEY